MTIALEFTIALKYLRSKNKNAFISITAMLSLLGISIGVASLIVVMSVMNGYREELSHKLRGFNSDITITGTTKNIDQYTKITNLVSKVKGVKVAIPMISEQALLITSHQDSLGILVKAIPKKLIKTYPILKIPPKQNLDGIILGYNAAQSLQLKIGQPVKIMSLHFDTTVIGSMPKTTTLPITMFFKSGISEYDNLYVIMPLENAAILFDSPNKVNRIEIFLEPGADVDQITTDISEKLKFQYIVTNWKTANQGILNALRTERVVMFVILTLIIIVAAFNIISSLTMLVTDKLREIAIMKTIGLSNSSIMRIFLIAGMILGIIGTICGVCLGLAISMNINEIKNALSKLTGTNLFDPIIYYLEMLPAKVDFVDTAFICFVALIVALLATLYPSYQASQTTPVQGLKND